MPVYKEVIKPTIQYVDRVIEKEIIKEVIKEIEVPIETVRVEIKEVIVEKIVEKERFVRVDDDCECISEAGFVAMWNKIMHIKFTDLRDQCLNENRMLDIILHGMKRRNIIHKEIVTQPEPENIIKFEEKKELIVMEPPKAPAPVIRSPPPRQTIT